MSVLIIQAESSSATCGDKSPIREAPRPFEPIVGEDKADGACGFSCGDRS
jgi:hypothetical protein